MRITRRHLKKLVESFLTEKKISNDCPEGVGKKQEAGPYICPRCGKSHKKEPANCDGCSLKYGCKFNGYDWGTAPKNQKKNENRLYNLFEQAIEFVCPEPAKSIKLNTVNRDRGIKEDYIKYGPLNLNDEDYWEKYAEKWGTTADVAKESNCGNCVAFDESPQMKGCMPGETSDEEGHLGYCWMHHFKCHSARTCNTWAKGGPITEDKVSTGWFEKNKEAALFNRSHEEFLKRQTNED